MKYGIIKSISTNVEDNVNGGTIEVPVFSPDILPSSYCARYVRLAAEHLFDKNFPRANAWGLHDKCKVVSKVNGNSDLVSLAEEGILTSGMVVGLFNPNTVHKNPDYRYTHVALYLGLDGNTPLFAEQHLGVTKVSDIYDFANYSAKEILDVLD